MKVLIIPSWYPNKNNVIAGSFFHEQAQLLNNNGYDVRILYGNTFNYGFKYLIKNFIRKLFVGQKKEKLDTSFLIQNPEAFSFTINMFGRWNEQRKIKQFLKMYEKAFKELLGKGWKPDIIHAQCTIDGGIAAMHLSKLFEIPYLIIEHQVFLLSKVSPFKKKLVIEALEAAHKVGAVSNHQKRAILTNGINCNPVILLNWINENNFQIKPILSNKKFRILYISYPNFIKDNETFFKSMSLFFQLTKEDVEIVVVGDNSFRNSKNAELYSFKYLAKKHNVFEKCLFISQVSRNEIAELYRTVNVFVSTSIAETFGVAVREAMLSGVPVICTKSGGVEDSVNDRTGVLVNIGDYEAIAKALIQIKNGELKFNTNYIRDFIIEQCGNRSFLNNMNNFYS